MLAARQREVVRAQTKELAGVLRAGHPLYLAPEGVISPDGRLQAFRSGLEQLLSLTQGEVGVRPVCIVYDFMRPGRLHVFIAVGRRVKAEGAPDACAAATRRRLGALHVMTATQIASQVVWDHLRSGGERLDCDALLRGTTELATALRAEGLRVDPALLRYPAAAVSAWVRYAVRQGWARPVGSALQWDGARITSTPATHHANPIRYAVNELQSVRAAMRGTSPVVGS